MLRTIFIAAFLSSGLFAQDYLLLTGYSDSVGPTGPGDNSFPVSRFRDLNGDGTIDDASELFAFLSVSFNTRNMTGGELASFMSGMDWVQEGDNWAFYIADSGDGRITRGMDENNNGVLDASEITEFFDFQSGFAPDAIAAHYDAASGETRVYVAMDDSSSPFGEGIHRLVDLNGDGDAKDANEQSAFVSAAANLSVPGTSGNVTLVTHDWEQVHTLHNGTVIAFSRASSSSTITANPDRWCWYAFTDNNGTASASVFFNPSQLNAIPAYPDFAAGGQFPQWDVVFSSGQSWNNVEFFAAAPPNQLGLRDYYFTSSYNSGYVDTNPGGTKVHGLVYRWRDLNQDDGVDAGEVTLFANFSGQTVGNLPSFTVLDGGTTLNQLNERVFGVKAADGKVQICWEANSKYVMELDDANQNGVIDQGEAQIVYKYSGATNTVYSVGFGPYIKDFSAFSRGFMPGPFTAGLTPYGSGCAFNGNGLSPVCDAKGPPKVGNAGFELGVQRLPPNLPTAYVAISLARQTPAIPLPSPPFPSGCEVLVDLAAGYLGAFGPFAADADGVISVPVPIPNVPVIAGNSLVVQWPIVELGTPARLVLSNALEVTLQP